jgi:hypothetical protein
MPVFVLYDVKYGIFSVVSDREVAGSFVTYDPDFRFVECELDDYRVCNEARELCEDYDDIFPEPLLLPASTT